MLDVWTGSILIIAVVFVVLCLLGLKKLRRLVGLVLFLAIAIVAYRYLILNGYVKLTEADLVVLHGLRGTIESLLQ